MTVHQETPPPALVQEDFWRSGGGANRPDGTNDPTEAINRTGNTGIGHNDTPSAKLDVVGSAIVGAAPAVRATRDTSVAANLLNAVSPTRMTAAAVTAAEAVARYIREGTGSVAYNATGEWRIGRWAGGVAARTILELWLGNGNSQTPDTKVIHFRSDGRINTPALPTFANDAAAGVGGLVQHDWYKTPGGVLHIKL